MQRSIRGELHCLNSLYVCWPRETDMTSCLRAIRRQNGRRASNIVAQLSMGFTQCNIEGASPSATGRFVLCKRLKTNCLCSVAATALQLPVARKSTVTSLYALLRHDAPNVANPTLARLERPSLVFPANAESAKQLRDDGHDDRAGPELAEEVTSDSDD